MLTNPGKLPDREKPFLKNESLEELLKEINDLLEPANKKLLSGALEKYTKIFVVGALRSGTTLSTQWLASTGAVAYPTNILSRFYKAPLVGAKIQQLLCDPRFNFRNEILDFNSGISFFSENGKTKGAMAPNEFWYFWRRFLPFRDIDYLPDDELRIKADLDGLRDEINAISNIFNKPFALKALIMNQNLPILNALFDKALFLWVKRDPVFNIQSALEARKRQYGDVNTWYSFKIKEYHELSDLDPLRSVAGQIYAINSSIEKAFETIPEHKKIVLQYEVFCKEPEKFYTLIIDKMYNQDGLPEGDHKYNVDREFENKNKWRLKEYSQEDAAKVYAEISKGGC